RASAVLRAEIAFLERPERLRALAARHLGLQPTEGEQETTLESALLALGDPAAQARYAAAQQAGATAGAEAEPAPAPEARIAEAAPEPDAEPSLIEQLQQPESRV